MKLTLASKSNKSLAAEDWQQFRSQESGAGAGAGQGSISNLIGVAPQNQFGPNPLGGMFNFSTVKGPSEVPDKSTNDSGHKMDIQ